MRCRKLKELRKQLITLSIIPLIAFAPAASAWAEIKHLKGGSENIIKRNMADKMHAQKTKEKGTIEAEKDFAIYRSLKQQVIKGPDNKALLKKFEDIVAKMYTKGQEDSVYLKRHEELKTFLSEHEKKIYDALQMAGINYQMYKELYRKVLTTTKKEDAIAFINFYDVLKVELKGDFAKAFKLLREEDAKTDASLRNPAAQAVKEIEEAWAGKITEAERKGGPITIGLIILEAEQINRLGGTKKIRIEPENWGKIKEEVLNRVSKSKLEVGISYNEAEKKLVIQRKKEEEQLVDADYVFGPVWKAFQKIGYTSARIYATGSGIGPANQYNYIVDLEGPGKRTRIGVAGFNGSSREEVLHHWDTKGGSKLEVEAQTKDVFGGGNRERFASLRGTLDKDNLSILAFISPEMGTASYIQQRTTKKGKIIYRVIGNPSDLLAMYTRFTNDPEMLTYSQNAMTLYQMGGPLQETVSRNNYFAHEIAGAGIVTNRITQGYLSVRLEDRVFQYNGKERILVYRDLAKNVDYLMALSAPFIERNDTGQAEIKVSVHLFKVRKDKNGKVLDETPLPPRIQSIYTEETLEPEKEVEYSALFRVEPSAELIDGMKKRLNEINYDVQIDERYAVLLRPNSTFSKYNFVKDGINYSIQLKSVGVETAWGRTSKPPLVAEIEITNEFAKSTVTQKIELDQGVSMKIGGANFAIKVLPPKYDTLSFTATQRTETTIEVEGRSINDTFTRQTYYGTTKIDVPKWVLGFGSSRVRMETSFLAEKNLQAVHSLKEKLAEEKNQYEAAKLQEQLNVEEAYANMTAKPIGGMVARTVSLENDNGEGVWYAGADPTEYIQRGIIKEGERINEATIRKLYGESLWVGFAGAGYWQANRLRMNELNQKIEEIGREVGGKVWERINVPFLSGEAREAYSKITEERKTVGDVEVPGAGETFKSAFYAFNWSWPGFQLLRLDYNKKNVAGAIKRGELPFSFDVNNSDYLAEVGYTTDPERTFTFLIDRISARAGSRLRSDVEKTERSYFVTPETTKTNITAISDVVKDYWVRAATNGKYGALDLTLARQKGDKVISDNLSVAIDDLTQNSVTLILDSAKVYTTKAPKWKYLPVSGIELTSRFNGTWTDTNRNVFSKLHHQYEHIEETAQSWQLQPLFTFKVKQGEFKVDMVVGQDLLKTVQNRFSDEQQNPDIRNEEKGRWFVGSNLILKNLSAGFRYTTQDPEFFYSAREHLWQTRLEAKKETGKFAPWSIQWRYEWGRDSIGIPFYTFYALFTKQFGGSKTEKK